MPEEAKLALEDGKYTKGKDWFETIKQVKWSLLQNDWMLNLGPSYKIQIVVPLIFNSNYE